MTFGSFLLDVCLVLTCILSAVRCSDVGQSGCPCSRIPAWDLTERPPDDCQELNRTFRYTCIKGYVRTAGTSNLIKCTPGSSNWTRPTLVCKPDPRGSISNSADRIKPTSKYQILLKNGTDGSPFHSEVSVGGSVSATAAVVGSVVSAVGLFVTIGIFVWRKRRVEANHQLQTRTEEIL